MADKKVIAVVGATGAQGGGVADAILNDPTGGFAVRAVTRDPNSEKARQLSARGAEVVQGDVDDVASLRKAFEGAYGAYCVTFFWAHCSPDAETASARNMAQAAKDSGVRHAIWSTLEDTRKWVPLSDSSMPTLMGEYKVPHLDAKGQSDQFFRDMGVPTTFLLTSFYWDNFIHFGMGPQPGPDGKLMIAFPMDDKKLPGIAAGDIGGCPYSIFKRPEFIGKTVGIAGEHLSGVEMAAAFTKAIGREVGFYPISPDAYRALGFPGAEDLGNMFQFKRDFNDYYCGARSIAFSRELNPKLQTFAQWLEANKNAIPIP